MSGQLFFCFFCCGGLCALFWCGGLCGISLLLGSIFFRVRVDTVVHFSLLRHVASFVTPTDFPPESAADGSSGSGQNLLNFLQSGYISTCGGSSSPHVQLSPRDHSFLSKSSLHPTLEMFNVQSVLHTITISLVQVHAASVGILLPLCLVRYRPPCLGV